jgi:hypothetical protein
MIFGKISVKNTIVRQWKEWRPGEIADQKIFFINY